MCNKYLLNEWNKEFSLTPSIISNTMFDQLLSLRVLTHEHLRSHIWSPHSTPLLTSSPNCFLPGPLQKSPNSYTASSYPLHNYQALGNQFLLHLCLKYNSDFWLKSWLPPPSQGSSPGSLGIQLLPNKGGITWGLSNSSACSLSLHLCTCFGPLLCSFHLPDYLAKLTSCPSESFLWSVSPHSDWKSLLCSQRSLHTPLCTKAVMTQTILVLISIYILHPSWQIARLHFPASFAVRSDHVTES